MSNYTDLALRLAQFDAQIKTANSRGAAAVRKQRQCERKIVALRTQLEDALEETQKLAAEVASLKQNRKLVILEIQTRTDQTK